MTCEIKAGVARGKHREDLGDEVQQRQLLKINYAVLYTKHMQYTVYLSLIELLTYSQLNS